MTELYFITLYFFVYGFLGWCTEVAFAAWKEHRFVNRGFLNGPICPIYGFGVTMVVRFLSPYKANLVLLYITSVILVTALEWLTGFILEKLFHNKWWDYSKMPLNIGKGRKWSLDLSYLIIPSVVPARISPDDVLNNL